MSVLNTFIVSLALLVITNAEPSTKDLKDDWTLVPSRFGFPIPVNVTEVLASSAQLSFDPVKDVKIELYTLTNKDEPQILVPNDIASITSSKFNKSLPTRIYIHGWQEYFGNMKKCFNDAYLNKAKLDVNLIAINWESSSRTLDYVACANRVERIGFYVAELVDFLVKNDLASLNDINLIGFSLGAHIAGIAGKQIQTGRLKKIVGLDPAGPLFFMHQPQKRLDSSDAEYVEVVHTSGAFLGFYDPIGTVNFYPNKGRTQIGCRWDLTGTCSHLRAFKYFAESLYSPVPFHGHPCETLNEMKRGRCEGDGTPMGGEPGNYRAESHIYLLETNTKPLFARGN